MTDAKTAEADRDDRKRAREIVDSEDLEPLEDRAIWALVDRVQAALAAEREACRLDVEAVACQPRWSDEGLEALGEAEFRIRSRGTATPARGIPTGGGTRNCMPVEPAPDALLDAAREAVDVWKRSGYWDADAMDRLADAVAARGSR